MGNTTPRAVARYRAILAASGTGQRVPAALATSLLVLLPLFAVQAHAESALLAASPPRQATALDVGRSHDGTDFMRVGLRRDFKRTLYSNDRVSVAGFHEFSLNHWSGYGDSTFGVAWSPVFIASFCRGCRYEPYVEAGIGAALISSTTINERDMSSLFQFEDRIGFGVRTRDVDLHFRYMHYSNASTVSPNDGIDIYVLGFAYGH